MAATAPRRTSTPKTFRVGRVQGYLRGRVWYLRYTEEGRRRQPRVGVDQELARQMAAQINAQLEVGAPSALGFEPVSVAEVQTRWLDNHEHVRRSSLQTISRYRAATNHLLTFVDQKRLRRISDFRPMHAEEFVRYLRTLETAPNGHKNARKRRLRDSGVKYILETCCTLFNYARRQRHLSPYAENPFLMIEVGRIPIEDAKPIIAFDEQIERKFFEACDAWQLPVFLTLLLTGLRPGELVHLLLPDDLDLEEGWLRVRNKPRLGWQVKTRNERDIPLMPVLVRVLSQMLSGRRAGPVFRQRQFSLGATPKLAGLSADQMAREIELFANSKASDGGAAMRTSRQQAAKAVWRRAGALKTDTIRIEFMRLMAKIELPEITAPKTLRHSFATILQDGNVDPLIRNELMGHSPAGHHGSGSLGMTAVYTHTRPMTRRRQLEAALESRPAIIVSEKRQG